jgi:hypothetical protein
MKLSAIAAGLKAAGLLATDASDPKVISALATMLATDKKGKDDNSGLGPKELEQKDKAKDKKGKDAAGEGDNPRGEDEDMPEGMDAKAWDAMSDEEKKDAKDKARDSKDKDDPEGTNDADVDVQPKESVTGASKSGQAGAEPAKDKKATDAAIKVALDARDALHTARRDVETTIGAVQYDTAAEVYKAALVKLGVSVDGVDPSAYGTIFKLARDKATASTPVIASDAAVVAGMQAVIPGYGRLK